MRLVSKSNPLLSVRRLKNKTFGLGVGLAYEFKSDHSAGYKAFREQCVRDGVDPAAFEFVGGVVYRVTLAKGFGQRTYIGVRAENEEHARALADLVKPGWRVTDVSVESNRPADVVA